MKRYASIQMAVLLVLCTGAAQAEVTVAKVFGDHMVLQRDIEVPVWGWAEPGEEATVEFAGQKKSSRADKSGKWMVRLAPLKASAEGSALVVRSSIPELVSGGRSQGSGSRGQRSLSPMLWSAKSGFVPASRTWIMNLPVVGVDRVTCSRNSMPKRTTQ